MKIKGKIFKSYIEPPRPSSEPKGPRKTQLARDQCWVSHTGRRARLKNLRLVCTPSLKSKDPELLAAIEKLREFTKDEPEAEYGFLHLLTAAQRSSFDSGVSVAESITYMLKNWAEQSHSTAELTPEEVK